VHNLPERNLAGAAGAPARRRNQGPLCQQHKFSDLLAKVIQRYQNHAIETAKKFKAALARGEALGLNADELTFYDALANNADAVREMGDETLSAQWESTQPNA